MDQALLQAPDYRACLKELVRSTPASLVCFHYDRAAGNLLLINLTFAENLQDLIYFLAVARGIGAFTAEDDSGFALIHNYIWGPPHSVAVMGIERAGSHFLNSTTHISLYEASIRQVVEALDQVMRTVQRPDRSPSQGDIENFLDAS